MREDKLTKKGKTVTADDTVTFGTSLFSLLKLYLSLGTVMKKRSLSHKFGGS